MILIWATDDIAIKPLESVALNVDNDACIKVIAAKVNAKGRKYSQASGKIGINIRK